MLTCLFLRTGLVTASQNESQVAYLEGLMDNDLPVHRIITGLRSGSHAVFFTAYGYFGLAAVVELICLACILPTYWGWWKLGRDVSFSPLEIAKVCCDLRYFFTLG